MTNPIAILLLSVLAQFSDIGSGDDNALNAMLLTLGGARDHLAAVHITIEQARQRFQEAKHHYDQVVSSRGHNSSQARLADLELQRAWHEGREAIMSDVVTRLPQVEQAARLNRERAKAIGRNQDDPEWRGCIYVMEDDIDGSKRGRGMAVRFAREDNAEMIASATDEVEARMMEIYEEVKMASASYN